MLKYFRTRIPYIKNIKKFSTSKDKLGDFPEESICHWIKHDYIGEPDKDSNLRPYLRCIPKNETPLARRLREKRIEVEKWNQLFWSRHNKRFYEEKKEFINLHKQAGIHVSSDKLSEFYKTFLDKNHKLHLCYNISWYIKNFELLVLAFQVEIQNIYRSIKNFRKK